MEAEEWRAIPKFRQYEVTRSGKVRNAETLRVMKHGVNKGTRVVQLTLDGKQRKLSVAAIVAVAFWEFPRR